MITKVFFHFKIKILLGRDAVPNPHVTFERSKVIIYAAYRRCITPPLFQGRKKWREKRLFSAPCRWAKRRLRTFRYAPRLQLSLEVRTIRHARTINRSLRAKLRNPYIAPKGSDRGLNQHCVSMSILYDNFLRNRFNGSPTHS